VPAPTANARGGAEIEIVRRPWSSYTPTEQAALKRLASRLAQALDSGRLGLRRSSGDLPWSVPNYVPTDRQIVE
jgi:hypothetical protein